jgi:hypothetical protein
MAILTEGNIIGVLSLASGLVSNWWIYRTKKQALANELQIARLHACVDANNRIDVEAADRQLAMHHENLPVMQATLEAVTELAEGKRVPGVFNCALETGCNRAFGCMSAGRCLSGGG